MSTNVKTEKTASVMPFAIEARTPRNQDLMIQCLGGMKLRGAVSATVEVFDHTWTDLDADSEDGERLTMPTPAKVIPGVGDLPGEQLYVNPVTGEWKTFDPLYKKEAVLDRIRRAIKNRGGVANVGERLRGIKARSGRVDADTMKTLCRELLCFIEAKEARVVKGICPDRDDVDELPGRYLLNWSNRSKWHQPRYEDQVDRWTEKLNQLDDV